jgi:hypothetical protein
VKRELGTSNSQHLTTEPGQANISRFTPHAACPFVISHSSFHPASSTPLVNPWGKRILSFVKGKLALPLALMVVFALSRIPGMLPQNFSAAYALAFCAGVYFSGRMAWWLPLGTLLLTDIALDIYYLGLGWDVFKTLRDQAFNYIAYAFLIWFGRRFKPRTSFVGLLGGGILGALVFYIVTNTASWFFNPFGNPEYTRNLTGLLIALTKGTGGWPQTWEFFRNTLMSGGLFTGLFVGAMKLNEAAESAQEKEPAEAPAGEDDKEPAAEEA